jgi:hypothetical protein
VKVNFETPEPHRAPLVVAIVDVTVTAAVVAGVNATGDEKVSPAFNVTPPLDGGFTNVTLGSEGAVKVNIAAALPVFLSCTDNWGAGVPTSVEAKVNVETPVNVVNVAPVGVAERGSTTLVLFGSLLKRASDPATGTPAVAELGTLAVTVRAPDIPGATVRAVGLSENALPAFEADTDSTEPPALAIVRVFVTGVEPQATDPRSILVSDRDKTGVLFDVASPASWPPPASASANVASPASWPTSEGASVVLSPARASPASLATDGEELSSPEPMHPARPTHPSTLASETQATARQWPRLATLSDMRALFAPRRADPFTRSADNCKRLAGSTHASHTQLTELTLDPRRTRVLEPGYSAIHGQ